ncbi:MAG: PAS domain S-box protein [Alphaproteobacteria bacterium]|nr:MAG: PAS domain S-box protein [Alphaproteobacteria bacterium]
MQNKMSADSIDFYESIVMGIPEALIVSKPDGTIIYTNPGTERLTGYAPVELKGQPITMLVPRREDRRADPVKWLQRWAHEDDDMQSRHLDLIGLTKDGRELPFSVRVAAAKEGANEVYIITFRDVSGQRAEQARFRDEHLKATRILQIAEDGIISIDADQKITFFNLKAEKMFGYQAEEVLGQPIDVLLPDGQRADHHIHVEGFGASKEPSRLMTERGRVFGKRKNGDVFPVRASITAVHVHGVPTYTAHVREITTD